MRSQEGQLSLLSAISIPGIAPLSFFAPELTMIVPSGAVVFDKGCYIGQELTARTKFRGEVCSFLPYF